MRKESIEELLEEVKEIFNIIKSYKKISKPKVKSICEHLRSSLEYAAQDINSKMPNIKKRLFFPYADNEAEFEKSIQRNLPQLLIQLLEVYSEIRKLQKFSSGNDWLVKLCNLTNDAKHNDSIDIHSDEELIKSVEIEVGGLNLIHLGGNCSNVIFTNNRVNGVLVDDFIFDKGKLEITKKGDLAVNYKITKDRKIIVGNEKIDLLPFLEECINQTEGFIIRLYKLL